MIVSNKKLKVPDKCGDFCNYYGLPKDMSAPCFRCPIMNCQEINGMSMCDADKFDAEIAQDFLDWWKDNRIRNE